MNTSDEIDKHKIAGTKMKQHNEPKKANSRVENGVVE